MTIRRLAWVAVGAALARAGCADPEEAADEAPLPDVATIVCDANGTTVETPSVRPQLDGIHILIDNRLEIDPGFSVRFGGGGMGDNAPPGLSNHTSFAWYATTRSWRRSSIGAPTTAVGSRNPSRSARVSRRRRREIELGLLTSAFAEGGLSEARTG